MVCALSTSVELDGCQITSVYSGSVRKGIRRVEKGDHVVYFIDDNEIRVYVQSNVH